MMSEKEVNISPELVSAAPLVLVGPSTLWLLHLLAQDGPLPAPVYEPWYGPLFDLSLIAIASDSAARLVISMSVFAFYLGLLANFLIVYQVAVVHVRRVNQGDSDV